MPDEWGTTQDGQTRPRVVKRGIDDNLDEIPDGVYSLLRAKVFFQLLYCSIIFRMMKKGAIIRNTCCNMQKSARLAHIFLFILFFKVYLFI